MSSITPLLDQTALNPAATNPLLPLFELPSEKPVSALPLTRRARFTASMRSLCARVSKVAIALLRCTVATGLYSFHPNLFYVGLAAGVVFHRSFVGVGDRMIVLWRHQDWANRAMIVTISLLTFPIFLASATFVVGAHVGASLMQEATDRSISKAFLATPS